VHSGSTCRLNYCLQPGAACNNVLRGAVIPTAIDESSKGTCIDWENLPDKLAVGLYLMLLPSPMGK
jgi:hypothetical protein